MVDRLKEIQLLPVMLLARLLVSNYKIGLF
jgi:hypothetical protein